MGVIGKREFWMEAEGGADDDATCKGQVGKGEPGEG